MDETKNNAEKLEPGVYGETDPAEQKFIENLSHLAAGYMLAKGGGEMGEALMNKIKSSPYLMEKLSSEMGGISKLDDLHKMAGLTSEESIAAKQLVEKPNLPTIVTSKSGESPVQGPHAIYRGSSKSFGDFYDVRNSSINTKSNVVATLSGPNALKTLQENNIPIVGKTVSAADQVPDIPYGHLFKTPELTPSENPMSQGSMLLRQSWVDKLRGEQGVAAPMSEEAKMIEDYRVPDLWMKEGGKGLASVGPVGLAAYASKGFPLSQENKSELQSLRDRMKNSNAD